MKNRRDFLASIAAATALGGCDMPAPRRPYPFRNGRGLSFKTLKIDNFARTCAVGVLEERPGGRFRERIALVSLEALGGERGQSLVAKSPQGEPGCDDWLPVFGDEGSHLYFSRVSRADEARFKDRALTRIIRRNLESGAQEVVLEVSAKALPQAVFQVEGESYLIYLQAVEFIPRGYRKGRARKFALRTVRLAGGGKVPAFGPLHDDVNYEGQGIAIPGIGYLFHRNDRVGDERDVYRFSALSMKDIKNGSLEKFSNLEDSVEYISKTNHSSIQALSDIRIAAEIFRLSITYEVDERTNIIGNPPELRDWGTNIDYDVNSRYGIELKGRSVLDDERDLERVPFAIFKAGEIPMRLDRVGTVNFLSFVESNFPVNKEM
ncbi:hypothetical protein [Phenylobacterium sp.]|jgi:hypothetical protein|uniref:hypothetical protein n=1 Tax=Phenylobacterium sp. TaxID=1871053 RepID=UPI0037CC27D6